MRQSIQPYPWHVQFRQYDQGGRASRPLILDDKGKPVRLGNPKHATLMAAAPLLQERLRKLLYRAEMLHMQIQSALALNLPQPKELDEARELLDALRLC